MRYDDDSHSIPTIHTLTRPPLSLPQPFMKSIKVPIEQSPNPSHTKILFVCLGNICRSPAAEIICRAQLKQRALAESVIIDSCGTAAYHIGKKADPRMLKALCAKGYSDDSPRARQFTQGDFARFDLIIPQDDSNMAHLLSMANTQAQRDKIIPMRSYFPQSGDCSHYSEVPDPYYGGAEGFDEVIDLLSISCANIIDNLSTRANKTNN